MKLFTLTVDLDGTICNTYARPTWLEELQNCNSLPFKKGIAQPFTKRLFTLKILSLVAHIDICTWLPPQASTNKTFAQECIENKIEWVKHYLPFVRNINCLQYGVPKQGEGILIDDSKSVRSNWKGLALSDQWLGRVEHAYTHH